MDATEVERYLSRIGFDQPITHDRETLAALQLAHLRSAPFENLDVVAGEPMPVDVSWSLPKIVERRRGGWCFELNGAFAALLEALGFRVERHAAVVLMGGEPSPMDDHLCLWVQLDQTWLVDVGFGDSFTQPLLLASDEPVHDEGAGRRFRLADDGDRRALWSEHDGEWRLDYRFTDQPVELSYFEPAAQFLRTAPGLPWSAKRFLTRLTDTGRVTLLDKRLRVVSNGEVDETPVESVEQWDGLALEWFGHG